MSEKKDGGPPPVRSVLVKKSLSTAHHTGTLGKPREPQGDQGANNESGGDSGTSGNGSQQGGDKTDGDK